MVRARRSERGENGQSPLDLGVDLDLGFDLVWSNHGRGFGFGGRFGTAELRAHFGCEGGCNDGAKLFYRDGTELRFFRVKNGLVFRGGEEKIEEKRSSRVSFFFS